VEGELHRVAGGDEVDRPHGADLALVLEPGPEALRRLAQRRRAVAARPRRLRLVEIVRRP
jgi:hypothetical protein